jgi:ferredoxin
VAVFVDEESCIGCMQCANVAPNAFVMVESGRARTFQQRSGADVEQAVASCPVSCMHSVSYQELKEFEIARDEGDDRTDHRHLGHKRGHTPLNVAGIDSDRNLRSSWYHTLKEKCLISSNCPQNACYDCPKYSKPGQNPFFVAKHKKSEHIRAEYFIENGEVDDWRKTADL